MLMKEESSVCGPAQVTSGKVGIAGLPNWPFRSMCHCIFVSNGSYDLDLPGWAQTYYCLEEDRENVA